jgi:NADPH:quinone reductase-like Zn-dependent oxidoreductase
MKAIQIPSHGGLEVLQSTTLPDPTPKAGEVLVRVKASAVNPLDGIVRMGYFPIAAKPPLILGEEASGLTERDGAGFKAGEKVIVYGGGLGAFRDGTWADLVAVPATSVRKLPEGVSFEEGAALSNVGVTAYGALRHGGLKAGKRSSCSARLAGSARLASSSARHWALASSRSSLSPKGAQKSEASELITSWRFRTARSPKRCRD